MQFRSGEPSVEHEKSAKQEWRTVWGMCGAREVVKTENQRLPSPSPEQKCDGFFPFAT